VEEERRLLYVGITRAREHLELSWARARTPGGRGSRSPSRFLDGLFPGARPADAEPAAGGRRQRGRERAALPRACRVCSGALATAAERKVGRCSTCPPTYDEATFERLRAWRSTTAAEAKVPAYVVFTDATLVAIAETRPADLTGLAKIAGVGPAKLDRYGGQVLELIRS
jgi:DNA helicase-2/ATP-dependent DNA helicase PcrA